MYFNRRLTNVIVSDYLQGKDIKELGSLLVKLDYHR